MTDPSANRKIHLALGIQSGLETVDYYPRLRAIVNCFQALLNPSSQIDFPVALVISHYLYNIYLEQYHNEYGVNITLYLPP